MLRNEEWQMTTDGVHERWHNFWDYAENAPSLDMHVMPRDDENNKPIEGEWIWVVYHAMDWHYSSLHFDASYKTRLEAQQAVIEFAQTSYQVIDGLKWRFRWDYSNDAYYWHAHIESHDLDLYVFFYEDETGGSYNTYEWRLAHNIHVLEDSVELLEEFRTLAQAQKAVHNEAKRRIAEIKKWEAEQRAIKEKEEALEAARAEEGLNETFDAEQGSLFA